MPPIIGIYASQISGHLAPPITGSYDALVSYTVPSGGASSVTISGLPQSGYQHLQIRALLLPNSGGGNTNYIQLNGDTSANYSWHMLRNASALSGGGDVEMILPSAYGSPSSIIIDILDYTNTTKYKTIRAIGGGDNNTAGFVNFTSGNWRSTSSINSFKLYSNSGSYLQYSNIAVYGIRG